jgi:hypothetical protein
MKKDKYAPVRQALRVGRRLSNVAYNLAQKSDASDPEDWRSCRQTLDELRREWDAVEPEARRALKPKTRTRKR